jgi:hypothetical protein
VHPAARKTGRPVVHVRKHDMRRHDRGQPVGDQAAVRLDILVQVRKPAAVDRHGDVRIGHHEAMAGEMFGGGRHARLPHAAHEGDGEFRDYLRVAMKGAIADHRAHAIVEIDTGGETHIDADGAQFRRH